MAEKFKLSKLTEYLDNRTKNKLSKRSDEGLIFIIQDYNGNDFMKNDSSLIIRGLSKVLGYFPTTRTAKIAYDIMTQRQNEGNFIIPKSYINFSK